MKIRVELLVILTLCMGCRTVPRAVSVVDQYDKFLSLKRLYPIIETARKEKKRDEELSALLVGAEIAPKDSRIRELWAGYLAEEGFPNDAVVVLKSVLSDDPNYAPAYATLAELLERNGYEGKVIANLCSYAKLLNPLEQRYRRCLERAGLAAETKKNDILNRIR